MSAKNNAERWKNDERSKEDRIREARSHILTKNQRRANAQELQKLRANLIPEEQLAKLDERLGKSYGAQRERARLNQLIQPAINAGEVQ